MKIDTRKPLIVKIDPELHERIRRFAGSQGMTMTQVVEHILNDRIPPIVNPVFKL